MPNLPVATIKEIASSDNKFIREIEKMAGI